MALVCMGHPHSVQYDGKPFMSCALFGHVLQIANRSQNSKSGYFFALLVGAGGFIDDDDGGGFVVVNQYRRPTRFIFFSRKM